MFSTIYKYELKFWLKQPSIYFYLLFFFFVPCLAIWGMASEDDFERTGKILNSASNIMEFGVRRFFLLVLFVLPGIIGYSIFRDFKSGMHLLLYSFPFDKKDYLFGKFLSAFTVTAVIGAMVLVGFMLGFQLAGGTANHLLPLDIVVYLETFFVFILPNLFFFGVLIFAVVTFSRNIYVGYIAVVVLILFRQIISAITGLLGNDYLSVLLEPMGVNAIRYTTQFWTIAEKNQNYLPLDGIILDNRLLWVSLGIIIFIWMYRTFSFSFSSGSTSTTRSEITSPKVRPIRSISKVVLPSIHLDFSFKQQLKTVFRLAWIDFKFIINSWMFMSIVIIGGLAVIFIVSQANPMFGTKSLPITSQMLSLPMMFFSGIINLLTFLYAGMLIHRSKLAKANQLVDISPLPNWVFLSSKILAITMMQIILLSLLMFGGIFNQLMNAYYQLEIGHYLFELFGLNLIHFILWTFLAVFIQSLFDNPYLGFFVLILLVLGMVFIGEPIKQLGFPTLAEPSLHYNQVPGPPPSWLLYSDMDGYGNLLRIYLVYKAYWVLAGMLLLIGSILFWNRGLTFSIKEKCQLAKSRLNPQMVIFVGVVSSLFLSMGYWLFHDSYYNNQQLSEGERKKIFRVAEKKFNHYNNFEQPTIKSVKINMDIYPESRDFVASGKYMARNETAIAIDTLIFSYLPNVNTKYDLDQAFETVIHENVADYIQIDILKLKEQLLPGDSLEITFTCQNKANTFMQQSSLVKGNGTYIEDDIFLRLGNWMSYIREENEWGSIKTKVDPTDSVLLINNHQDFIDFEAIVSTNDEQLAVAPGNLIKEWTEEKRRFFHYKTNQPIGHSFLFMSGEYEVKKEKWNDVDLEIYYHKNHSHNIDRIMAGKKAALDYCSKNFSPYPFKQLRTIEFAQAGHSSAHSFPTAIPTGEGTGFVADVDDSESGGIDFAFGTSVHETAHQWWGNELQASDIPGYKMVVESLAEYVNVMIKKHEKGQRKMHSYLHQNMDIYLKGRTYDSSEEQPLMYTDPNQNYIHYPKGAIVFYALSDYIGEQNLNTALRKFYQAVRANEIPATSTAMVNLIKEATPDSLTYIIEDMLETITLHDNRLLAVASKALSNGQYQVDIEFLVSKYRSDGKGMRSYTNALGDSLKYQMNGIDETIFSYPLNDYIEIGVFGEKLVDGEMQEIELYLAKHKVVQINNSFSIIVDQKPASAGIDPYVKLIDLDKGNNRRGI